MPVQYKDHPLSDNLRDFRECHIEPDWLFIYRIHEDTLILSATATGSHADFLENKALIKTNEAEELCNQSVIKILESLRYIFCEKGSDLVLYMNQND